VYTFLVVFNQLNAKTLEACTGVDEKISDKLISQCSKTLNTGAHVVWYEQKKPGMHMYRTFFTRSK
jgi:hypothetical protein